MDIHGFLTTHQLPSSYAETAQKWFTPLCEQLLKHQEGATKPFIVGINGSQGSGKSTLTSFVEYYLSSVHGKQVVSLSIDDFYFDQSQRNALAIKVHPLLATRGVPGTHNIPLALDTLRNLDSGSRTLLPRFDKATDNPFPTEQWPVIASSPDFIILEGWCVGATPQSQSELKPPINHLEEVEDPLGIWRSFVNTELAGDYQTLFAKIDYRIMLKAPSFDCVYQWRLEQEHKLAKKAAKNSTGVMSDEEVANFVQHYQRITEHALRQLPKESDTVFYLDETRTITKQDVKQ
ncbi:kinase [Alteromonas mediterranea]|uniref:Kinase n=2 Tax=Alteromonas mediterranea TaxID=314275 RepID=A0AAC9AE69_9ALTE|nr:kinase [Alteromonas mediterranea]AEA98322.1 kinase [Alteromonas mediterranea DE]AFV85764.1 kinase-like protein [Alteromonas mediterranea DE1]AGP97777.1 kinase-like protein [Alteromonas mediterranea UM7]AGQ02024.1 kinase-like protein [Alteromonas mediterranea UM4b]AMJ78805.1 kinase [Alteromonas mediterranea]|tara:strand:+ start:2340 stop:3212 length:873 start_codon:yes stop_codon:yes gene_type:complete